MSKVLPLLIIVFLLYLLVRYWQTLKPEQRKPFVMKYAVYAAMAIFVLAVVTGRIHWIGAVFAGALGLLKLGASNVLRVLPFIKMMKNSSVISDPVFRTPNLELKLDLSTGALSGTVLAGEFKQRTLSSLSESDFSALIQAVKEKDKRAYYLLQVYRQKQGLASDTEQDPGFDQQSPTVSDTNIDEAKLILGLDGDFTKKDIDRAYKRLMQKLHPDRGGSDYLASRVNTARDTLLNFLNKKN